MAERGGRPAGESPAGKGSAGVPRGEGKKAGAKKRTPSRRWRVLLPLIVVVVVVAGLGTTSLVLNGSLGTPAAPVATPSPSATAPVDEHLKIQRPPTLTAATAETETKRLADAMQALIDPSLVVHVDDQSQLVAKTTEQGTYYGVLRAIQINPQVDPTDLAKQLVSALKDAGWVERQTSDTDTNYLTALSSGDVGDTSWFVLVGGDASVPGQSVLSLQLASPDLP